MILKRKTAFQTALSITCKKGVGLFSALALGKWYTGNIWIWGYKDQFDMT